MENNISVILIARNEEENIAKMIAGLRENYAKEIRELIVVDDASTDKTPFIVADFKKRDPKIKLVKRLPPCGVGRALKTGFNNISPEAEYVLMMDSDFVDNIKEVRLLIGAIEQGPYDGAIGSRFIKDSRVIGYPLGKRIMNRGYHFLLKHLLRIKQNDLTNNFKLYKTHIVKSLVWKSDGYSINAEIGALPIIAGYHIAEVPISWVGRTCQRGKSKFRMRREAWGYIKVILFIFGLLLRKTTV